MYESFFITIPSFDSVQSHFITSIFVTKASRVSYFQPLPHGAGVSTFQSPFIIGPQDFSQYLSIVSSAWIDVQCQERHKKKAKWCCSNAATLARLFFFSGTVLSVDEHQTVPAVFRTTTLLPWSPVMSYVVMTAVRSLTVLFVG